MQDISTLVRVFGRVGLLSFGGPAAQIALMHRALVDEQKWMKEDEFLRALSFCMLLPGPEAMQLATYAGWRLRGIPGGLIAGGLFVLPGAIVIATLAFLYAEFGAQPDVSALMLGVKAAVIAIVFQALWKLSNKALKSKQDVVLSLLAFLAIYTLGVPFPIIILTAAGFGALSHSASSAEAPEVLPVKPTPPAILALWAGLWLLPLPVLWLLGQDLLLDMALFFGKLAVVTFGGAYAVLAYMAQDVVQVRGWLDATQMVDALGLAETTPGPLILVTQFVGQVTGHTIKGPGFALLAGGVTLWMTFVPCFLWIFAGAPYVERLLAIPRLRAALTAIKAAVVGVILNLSLWFTLHVLFETVQTHRFGPISLDFPQIRSVDLTALGLCVLGAALLWGAKRDVPLTILLCALAGLGTRFL